MSKDLITVITVAGITYHLFATALDAEKAKKNLAEFLENPNAVTLIDLILAGGIVAEDLSEL